MTDDVLAAVRAHVAAFNAMDVPALLEGFAEDAVFATGEQLFVGRRGIGELFAQAFGGGVRATMELRSAVVQGDTAACELAEQVSYQGHTLEFTMAAFYTLRDGKFARVKVYRDAAAEAQG